MENNERKLIECLLSVWYSEPLYSVAWGVIYIQKKLNLVGSSKSTTDEGSNFRNFNNLK